MTAVGGLAMLGFKGPPQGKLFYHNINLEQRVRVNHPLRNISVGGGQTFIIVKSPTSLGITSPSFREITSPAFSH
jgi:hypothetical protein